MALVEVTKLILILWSCWNRQLVPYKWVPDFVSGSIFAPFVVLVGIDYWGAILMRPSSHANILLRVIHQGILTGIPHMLLSAYFFIHVQQTGMAPLDTLSMVTTCLQVPYLLIRALFASRTDRERLALEREFDMLSNRENDEVEKSSNRLEYVALEEF